MVEILHLDEKNFDGMTAQGTVLVDFFATWCGPCRQQGLLLAELASGGKLPDDVRIAKVDIDAAPALANRFQVEAVPTLIVFKNGSAATRLLGVHSPEQLLAALA